MKNVYKWRITTTKYLYITDEQNTAPFIFDKVKSERIYSGSTIPEPASVDEGLIAQNVANINSAPTYETMFNNMVALCMTDVDGAKLTFLSYDNYFNLDDEECVIEAMTPKCEGYDPVFHFSAYTLDDKTEVEYEFYPEKNEADKTLRYNFILGIPRGEKGEDGDVGIGCKGDKGDDGKSAVIEADAIAVGLESSETPYVLLDVDSGTTESSNTYDMHFTFGIPQGEKGERGYTGETGKNGKPALFGDVTATAQGLPYGSEPTVDVISATTEYDDAMYTTVNFNFGIPEGPQGEQGDPGAPAIFSSITAQAHTIAPESSATVDVTYEVDDPSLNTYILNFDFGIPQGEPGESGGTSGGGGAYYNFSAQATPSSMVSGIILDWDLVSYDPTTNTFNYLLKLLYPSDWGGGGGTGDIKHRYDCYGNGSDSLSEGVLPVVGGESLPFACAYGKRSHAEGIGITSGSTTYTATIKIMDYGQHIGFDFDGEPDITVDIGDFDGQRVTVSGVTYTIHINDRTLDWYSDDAEATFYDYFVTYMDGITMKTLTSDECYRLNGQTIVVNREARVVPNAYGIATHTEGCAVQAIGDYSHAEGHGTVAYGNSAHAEGIGTDSGYQDINIKIKATCDDAEEIIIPWQNGLTTIVGTTFTVNPSDVNSSASYKDKITSSTVFTIVSADRCDDEEGLHLHFEYVYVQFVDTDNVEHTVSLEDLFKKELDYNEGYTLRVKLLDAIGAYGNASHTEGGSTYAEGDYSHAEGVSSHSGGVGSHAEGISTIADGNYSHAEGVGSNCSGIGAHAEGVGTITTHDGEHAEGTYNASNECNNDVVTISSVGIGTHNGNRKNAIEVMSNGDVYVYGVGGYWGKDPCSANSLQDSLGGGGGSLGHIYNATYDSLAEGTDTNIGPTCTASGERSHAEGHISDDSGYTTSKIEASDDGSHAEGKARNASTIQATNSGAHVGGYAEYNSVIESTENGSFAMGHAVYNSEVEASGVGAFAMGNANTKSSIIASGIGAFAMGNAYSHYNHIEVRKLTNTERTDIYNVIHEYYDYIGINGTVYSNSSLYDDDDTLANLLTTVTDAYLIQNVAGLSGYLFNVDSATSGNITSSTTQTTRYFMAKATGSTLLADSAGASAIGLAVDGGRIEGYSDGAHAEGHASDGGLIRSYSVGAHAEGHVYTNSTILADGDGSHAEGCANNGSEISVGGAGSHGEGLAENNSEIKTTSDGAHAQGRVDDNSKIEAGGTGSFSGGYGQINSSIITDSDGSFVFGYTYSGGTIESNAEGTVAMGCAKKGGEISVDGSGSHAEGYADEGGKIMAESQGASHAEGCAKNGGIIKTTGDGSHAEGYVDSGNSMTHAYGDGSHAEGYVTNSGSITATGLGAHAEGYSNSSSAKIKALGNGSHAEGYNTVASGDTSHAEGSSTQAIGHMSHAEGRNTKASGDGSHAEGKDTYAEGFGSHAEGYSEDTEGIKSLGYGSHAEGYCDEGYIIADGDGSHAGGVTYAGSYIKANGDATFTHGYISLGSMKANGAGSHAEGYVYKGNIQAIGAGSHAEGCLNDPSVTGNITAYGNGSHAEGNNTQTLGNYSHAEGVHSHTRGIGAHAEGYNIGTSQTITCRVHDNDEVLVRSDSVYLESLNGGTFTYNGTTYTIVTSTPAPAETRHNSFIDVTVTYSGGSGAQGISTIADGREITVTIMTYALNAVGNGSHTEGLNTTAYGNYAHAEGSGSTAYQIGSHAEGFNTIADNDYAHAEGRITVASGETSHAEGWGSKAYGEGAHAEGENTEAHGNYSHSEGENTEAHGNYSHAEGSSTKTYASHSHSEGEDTTASGQTSHAEGYSTTTYGLYSHAEGEGTTASGRTSHAEGVDTLAEKIGSHAEGYNTVASGEYAHAEGYQTTAGGVASFAGGCNSGSTSSIEATTEAAFAFGYTSGQASILCDGNGSIVGGCVTDQSQVVTYNNGCLAFGFATGGNGSESILTDGAGSVALGRAENYAQIYALETGSFACGYAHGGTGSSSSTNKALIKSEGEGAFAMGYAESGTTLQATGKGAHATGISTYANQDGMFATGRYNSSGSANELLAVGNGSGQSARRTVFNVVGDDSGSSTSTCTVNVQGKVNASSGFFQTSDERKKNVLSDLDLDKAYNLIDKCQTILYTLKEDNTNKEQIGMIAQEVQQFFPEIISEDTNGMLSLDYSKLTVIILKVLKDIIKRVSDLESKLNGK